MKNLKDFTDKEKIKIFDEVWKKSKEEYDESAESEDDNDNEQFFWEWIMETVLKINDDDWGKRIYNRF